LYTPIKDEIEMLIYIFERTREEMVEDLPNMHNLCIFTKQEGAIAQLGWALEQLTNTYLNIDEHIKYIMQNAIDGNYSAKMKIILDENALLKEKLEMYDNDIQVIKNGIDKENQARVKPIELEEGLET